MHIVGESAVGRAQSLEIVFEPRQDVVPGRASRWQQRKIRGKGLGSLFEAFEAEEFAP